jgi:hypothetical protein
MMAWFLEFGPKVWPLPPTTAGPDSGIFEASIACCGPWAFSTGTQSASGKAVKKANVKRTARFMANLRRCRINKAATGDVAHLSATFAGPAN